MSESLLERYNCFICFERTNRLKEFKILLPVNHDKTPIKN